MCERESVCLCVCMHVFVCFTIMCSLNDKYDKPVSHIEVQCWCKAKSSCQKIFNEKKFLEVQKKSLESF